MEAEEEEPLVYDALAAALAGPRALAAARSRGRPAPQGSGRKNKVNMITIRTKWFDDQLEASLGMPLGRIDIITDNLIKSTDEPDYVVSTVKSGNAPRQVVLLGAGMDSRAWRMKLPAGLRWFEVDRQDVLESKEMLLSSAGAEIEPTSPMLRSQSVNALLEQKIGSIDHHGGGVLHPLRAESWSGVVADLGDPSWVKSLTAAGFDHSKPTVWVAEGLVMYLEPDRTTALLREVASLSAAGSALLMLSVTEEVIEELKNKKDGGVRELMAEFKFGCPVDPTEWLQSAGWKKELVTTRPALAKSLGLGPEMCTFLGESGSTKGGRSLFIAASVA